MKSQLGSVVGSAAGGSTRAAGGGDRVLTRILSSTDVAQLLARRETEILDVVREAYVLHGQGRSSLPESVFLRFQGASRDRIISLPGFLDTAEPVAGMKWIASFPGNVEAGIPRASAVMVLNSCRTGYPTAVLEASQISAQRTAASAALAASQLAANAPSKASLIGAGIINFEVARFLSVVFPSLSHFVVYDLVTARSEALAQRIASELGTITAEVSPSVAAAFEASPLVSFGTTAVEPHVKSLSQCPQSAVILHVSLRDLAPEVILAANNVVDDRDHVCRAQTSVHLAEQKVGNRDFIWRSIDEVLEADAGEAISPPRPGAPIVFSPFGLGILDLAVAKRVLELAEAGDVGVTVDLAPPAS